MRLTFIVLACLASGLALGGPIPRERAFVPGPVQKIVIRVDNGFSGGPFTVRYGMPVKVVFQTIHRGCAKTVVFKELHLTKRLTDGKATVVTFTPATPGDVNFVCSMGTHRGTIQVRQLARRV